MANLRHTVELKADGPSTPLDYVSVGVDLDGMWAVKKCYNLDEGESFLHDPVYEESIFKYIELFRKFGIKADFFVVGRDMEQDWKAAVIKKVVEEGHDIGNHSYHHKLGLTLLDEGTLKTEILAAQAILKAVTGKWPKKFRSPGYDINGNLLKTLIDLKIMIDMSMFPSPWGIGMRFIDGYMRRWKGEKKSQYGSVMNFLAPLKPYYPDINHPYLKGEQRDIIEIPVTVTPYLRLPMQFGIIMNMGEKYFLKALDNLYKKHLPLHFVFHGIDLVDTHANPVFSDPKKNKVFGPSIEEKIAFAEKILIHIKNFEEKTLRY